jgi:hypothetical protein
MEMMDVRAAIDLLNNYAVLLEGTRKVVSRDLDRSYSDPEIAAHVASLQDSLKELCRNSRYASIAVSELLIAQVHLFINYPEDAADLLHAQAAQLKEANETGKLLDKIGHPKKSD